MEPVGELALVILKSLGLMLAVVAVFGIGLVVFLDLWAKQAVQSRIYAIFLEQRSLFSRLLKIDGEKIYLGRGDKKEEYLLDTTKQFWAWWPSGMPRIIQIPVRAHWYVRNSPEPIDPEHVEATISSRSMRMISDEALLRTMWRDMREATMGPLQTRRSSSLAIIMIFAILALVGFNLYLTMGIKSMLGG